jgi:hypothetical protein
MLAEQHDSVVPFFGPRPLDLLCQPLDVVGDVVLAMARDRGLPLAPQLAGGAVALRNGLLDFLGQVYRARNCGVEPPPIRARAVPEFEGLHARREKTRNARDAEFFDSRCEISRIAPTW